MSSCCEKERKLSLASNMLVWLVIAILTVMALSYHVPLLVPFRHAFVMYARMVFWPLVFGLILGGVIDHYVPREYISHVLSGKRKRSIVYAVLWGFLMTLCSHGILALAVQLYKKGASPASVVAFLLASPWANFPLTLMLVGLFGPVKAAFIVFAAIAVALITGWVFQVLEAKGMVEKNPHTLDVPQGFDMLADMKARMLRYRFDPVADIKGIARGVRELVGMVLWWILLGMSLASAAGAYIPGHFFNKFMGRSLAGLGVTLALATVIETCSEGSSPLAFEIYHQTGALGNALVFLMAGVATDYTEIGLLWVNAGRRTALWMPAIAVPLILLFGYIANRIF